MVQHRLQTWIVSLKLFVWDQNSVYLTEYLSRTYYVIQTCGVDPNPIVSHSSLRKASLDIRWCVSDLVISGANCHVGKFRCRRAVVLLNRDTRAHKKYTQWPYTHNHIHTHARTLIILGPSCEEGLLIGSKATWKITHSSRYFAHATKPLFILFSASDSDILKRASIWPQPFCKGGKLGLSLKAKSMTRFLHYCQCNFN